MSYKIINNVPMPAAFRDPRGSKYPFHELEVGQMFFIPDGSHAVATSATHWGKKLNRKFSLRTIAARETSRGWKVCEKDAPDAQIGVGVWRIA